MRQGERIGGFVIERELGRGGMAIVFAGRRVADGRVAAVKLIVDLLDPEQARRFEREQSALIALDRPEVIRVLESGVHAGRPFVAMELAEGGSLDQLLRREGQLPWRRAAELGAQVARGLAAVHAQGIVHRDVKPANVLLDREGRAKLADFGLVRRIESGSELTATGSILGTPAYMAPEQALGRAVDARSDLYALGCLLHALVAGDPPFAGTTIGVLEQHVTAAPPRLTARVKGVAPGFEALVLRLLEKDPAARPASASEVAEELARLAQGPQPGSTRRIAPLAAALLALGLLASAAILVWRRAPPAIEGPPSPAPLKVPSPVRSWRVHECLANQPITALAILPAAPLRVAAAQGGENRLHLFRDGRSYRSLSQVPAGGLVASVHGMCLATARGLRYLNPDGSIGAPMQQTSRQEALASSGRVLSTRVGTLSSFRVPASSPANTDLFLVDCTEGAPPGQRLLFTGWSEDDRGASRTLYRVLDENGAPTCDPRPIDGPGGPGEWHLSAVSTCAGWLACGYAEDGGVVLWSLTREGLGGVRYNVPRGSPVTALAGDASQRFLCATTSGEVTRLGLDTAEEALISLDEVHHATALADAGGWTALGTAAGTVFMAPPIPAPFPALRPRTSASQPPAPRDDVAALNEQAKRFPKRPGAVALTSYASAIDGARMVVGLATERLAPFQLEAWDLTRAPRRLACATGFGAPLDRVALSHDGTRMAAATAASEVYLFEVASADCLGAATVDGPVRRLWFDDAGLLHVGLDTGAIALEAP